jgi:[acyl-carrier-protein] S-malonyltransferase
VADVSRVAAESGAKAAPLAVSAAFHTADMASAGAALEVFMRAELTFRGGDIPLYTNLTGGPLPDDADLPGHTALQLQRPVRWRESVLAMAAAGADVFVEAGEGRTLSGLIRRIDRSAVCLTAGSAEALEKTLQTLIDEEG